MKTPTALALLLVDWNRDERAPQGRTETPAGATDRSLELHIVGALLATGHRVLRGITVSVRDRSVILRGRVPSYYLKQLAQSVVLAAPGAAGLRNELAVADLC